MTVLDASAVLALVHDGPGADVVVAAPPGSVLGTADPVEVVGELVDGDVEPSRLRAAGRRRGARATGDRG